MSHVITYSINYIKRRIPPRILKDAFMQNLTFGAARVTNIDSRIMESIFNELVLPDCNRVGGREMSIDISRLSPISNDTDGHVYKIPKSMTSQRSIISVKYASFIPLIAPMQNGMGSNYVGYNAGSSVVTGLAQAVMGSNNPDPVTGTSDCSIINGDENTIFIKDWGSGQRPMWILVLVENDSGLSQLDPKCYDDFAKLCLYATQMTIYNNLIIDLDAGKLQGGGELGRYKEIIDSYSDASANYETQLREVMEVVFLLSDPRRKQEHYYMISGGHR